MDSISPQCTPYKRAYEQCFTQWYQEKFLKGDVTPECQELFAEYKACVEEALRERKIDKMLDEARKEHPFD
ncbi:mitochondrial distribution/morphology family 35/apoptosis, partial [Syncephalis pseudoplumigaleata]